MNYSAETEGARRVPIRYIILALLFIITTINYADRATISIAGSAIKKDLHIDSVTLGFLFSAFGWSYVVGQFPGGYLLDRFGSKKVYLASIVAWSLCTFAQGFASWLTPAAAVAALFVLRLLLGLAESPSLPANSRIVAAWFPSHERGTAAAIFNTGQYAALVFFSPLMGWIIHKYNWHFVFFVMGAIGLVAALVFAQVVYAPHTHPRVTVQEFQHIAANGALVDLDRSHDATKVKVRWDVVRQLLTNRMLVGIYMGQYCMTALTYFFTTWFPVYLVEARHMTVVQAGFGAVAPALCGVAGGILGGLISDALLKKGKSLTFARKAPLVAGALLSTAIVLCNFTGSQGLIIAFMSLGFLGKGIAALGWAIISDAAPQAFTGLSAGIFNAFGNIAGITTPIAIGYIRQATGSFDVALMFVALHSILCILAYLFIVGPIRRFELEPA